MGLPLVISDYRHKKILKRFQVTPVSPGLLLAVQVCIYAIYALVSLLLLYAVGALFFGLRLRGSWGQFLGGYFLVMLSMFSIGMMVGGVAPNTKIAGIIASALYFPMLILSGATLPYLLPLTPGIKLLKAAALGNPASDVLVPIIVMAALALACAGVSVRFFRWE